MLKQKNRLTKTKDIEKAAKAGKPFFDQVLVLKKTKNNLDQPRIAFVVSQKISKKANDRNRIKRQLREIIKENLLKIKSGHDLIFFAKKGIDNKEYSEIKQTVEKLLVKSKLINSSWQQPDRCQIDSGRVAVRLYFYGC